MKEKAIASSDPDAALQAVVNHLHAPGRPLNKILDLIGKLTLVLVDEEGLLLGELFEEENEQEKKVAPEGPCVHAQHPPFVNCHFIFDLIVNCHFIVLCRHRP